MLLNRCFAHSNIIHQVIIVGDVLEYAKRYYNIHHLIIIRVVYEISK